MSYRKDHPVWCWHDGCSASHPGSKWDTISANNAGWFHTKDGKAWCPKHIPEWVSKWRRK